MTADDSRAVPGVTDQQDSHDPRGFATPDTEAEALAWFGGDPKRLACLDGATALAIDLRHAATLVRAALARDVHPKPLPSVVRGCANAVVDAWADWSGDADEIEHLAEAIEVLRLELARDVPAPTDEPAGQRIANALRFLEGWSEPDGVGALIDRVSEILAPSVGVSDRADDARDVPAGRDLTAQDVWDAWSAWVDEGDQLAVVARLNRIARGDQR